VADDESAGTDPTPEEQATVRDRGKMQEITLVQCITLLACCLQRVEPASVMTS